jgi:hypothetical protein
MKLGEEVIKECINVDSDALVVLQLIESEIVYMVNAP